MADGRGNRARRAGARRVGAAVAVTAVALTAGAAAAQAFYGNGATIVSASLERQEQGDDSSTFADISDGGRYVAFETRARNFFADDDPDPPGLYRQGGIFRRDLTGGGLELVADGDLRDEDTDDPFRRGALNASVSADGRFVAFSTAYQLVPADANDNVDVYVRDMSVPKGQSGAYDLISARSGSEQPPAYQPPSEPLPGFNFGSQVVRSDAISEDGRYVVFRTLVATNLPDGGPIGTPAYQVWLRDRQADTTTLVTRDKVSGDPAGGGEGPAGISGDGTTVLWTGKNAPAQTTFLNGEGPNNDDFHYLWKRVADGPSAPARRITGVADLDDPGCAPGSTIVPDPSATGPCYGPLVDAEGAVVSTPVGLYLPAMSDDGRRIAFLVGSSPRPIPGLPPTPDLWVTDMGPGVSRKLGTTELTREGLPGGESSPIQSVAMSGDGSRLGVVTARNRFVLPVLDLAGSARIVADTAELYVVDLEARTIERATRSYAGGEIGANVFNDISLDGTGERVAFVSSASNLFFGDANERNDAFLVTRQPDPGPEPPPPPPPANGGEEPPDEPPALPLRVARARGGAVRLTVRVPRAGTVDAAARARVTGGGRRRLRVVARVRGTARAAGTLALKLRPAARYRSLVRRRSGLRASLAVTFAPRAGGRRLSASRRITFILEKKAKR